MSRTDISLDIEYCIDMPKAPDTATLEVDETESLSGNEFVWNNLMLSQNARHDA
jgi:hypothetical protein